MDLQRTYYRSNVSRAKANMTHAKRKEKGSGDVGGNSIEDAEFEIFLKSSTP